MRARGRVGRGLGSPRLRGEGLQCCAGGLHGYERTATATTTITTAAAAAYYYNYYRYYDYYNQEANDSIS